ncbi:MAG: hypothetical protein HY000_17795 [Planctomycetes bacterium]|nr:hypothetical protein [Planctomycetota bacterium]
MVNESSESSETDRLLERAEAGDPSALETLFAGHRDYLRQMIDLRMDPKLRSRIDVSDVIQEAHVEAVRRIDDFLRRRPMGRTTHFARKVE